jgi:hypothetical protein
MPWRTPLAILSSSPAERLIDPFPAEAVIGDKGYGSNAFVKILADRGMQAVIPPRSHRLHPRTYDRHL